MKRLLILGGGTAGTMVANRLVHELDMAEWRITVVDQDETHYYQPGFLFIPFGTYGKADVMRPKRDYLPREVEVIISEIRLIEPDKNQVQLVKENRTLSYDYLIIATGSHIVPEETPGLMEDEWRKSIFDFYTPDGAVALHHFLRTWQGGRLVLNVAEMPIKCPVAPLEFAFLADAYFKKKGMRDRVELVYVTPLDGAFTRPLAARTLGGMLEERGIALEPDFAIERVDEDRKVIVSYDEREVPFDLLVTVPLNMGADYIARSGLGDELNYVPVDKHTFLSKAWPNIFAIGDASDIPASKAGSTAHFAVEVFAENFVHHIRGEAMPERFDGHANCFIESGGGKALLLDFNYDTEPLPGTFPLPKVGPFGLLRERRINHWGKLMFRWVYWHLLLKGRPIPIRTHLSMAGKVQKGQAPAP